MKRRKAAPAAAERTPADDSAAAAANAPDAVQQTSRSALEAVVVGQLMQEARFLIERYAQAMVLYLGLVGIAASEDNPGAQAVLLKLAFWLTVGMIAFTALTTLSVRSNLRKTRVLLKGAGLEVVATSHGWNMAGMALAGVLLVLGLVFLRSKTQSWAILVSLP